MRQDVEDVDHAPSVTIELDIFSGRPNPEWTPSAAETARVLRLLDDAPVASGHAIGAEPLGYRGFIVKVRAAGDTKRFHVHAGLIHSGEQMFQDPGNGTETSLLEMMPATLKHDFKDLLPR